MKTVKEWVLELPEPYRGEILKRMSPNMFDYETDDIGKILWAEIRQWNYVMYRESFMADLITAIITRK